MGIIEIQDKIRRGLYEISWHAEKERYEETFNMHKYDDCSFCGGEVKEDAVELDYRYKGKLYVFQNVPVGVCRQCGEKYLTAEIAKKIEQRVQSNGKWERTLNVPVEEFSAVAYA